MKHRDFFVGPEVASRHRRGRKSGSTSRPEQTESLVRGTAKRQCLDEVVSAFVLIKPGKCPAKEPHRLNRAVSFQMLASTLQEQPCAGDFSFLSSLQYLLFDFL